MFKFKYFEIHLNMKLKVFLFFGILSTSPIGKVLEKNGWDLQENIENENSRKIKAKRSKNGLEESFNEIASKKITPNSYSYSSSSSYGSSSKN